MTGMRGSVGRSVETRCVGVNTTSRAKYGTIGTFCTEGCGRDGRASERVRKDQNGQIGCRHDGLAGSGSL